MILSAMRAIIGYISCTWPACNSFKMIAESGKRVTTSFTVDDILSPNKFGERPGSANDLSGMLLVAKQ